MTPVAQGGVSFAEILRKYSDSYAAELKAQRKRLDGLVGPAHWLSVGSYKEALVRRLLRAWMPRKFEVSTGFVIIQHDDKPVMSKQIDVLIWDSSSHASIFRDEDFVIIPPEACKAAIEIKGTLGHNSLRNALDNLERVTTIARIAAGIARMPISVPFRGIFAFDAVTQDNERSDAKRENEGDEEDKGENEGEGDEEGEGESESESESQARSKNREQVSGNKGNGDSQAAFLWPQTVLNGIWNHYARKQGEPECPWSIEERIAESNGVAGNWTLPWIDMVCLLGIGVIQQEEWSINGVRTPAYSVYKPGEDYEGTYAAMERAIKMRLLAPEGYTHDRPGLVSALISGHQPFDEPAYLPMSQPPEAITSIGALPEDKVKELATKYHRPRGSQWPRPKCP